MTPRLQTDPLSEHTDVVLITDAYLRQAATASTPGRIDVVAEADALRPCALLFARRLRLLAITEAHDRTAQSAYAAAGFEVIHLNGNRAQALPALVDQELAALRQAPPQHLIVVSGDAAFSPLVQQALRRQTTVLVWWSGELPTALTGAACIVRNLERDVLTATRRTPRVAIYIDYENIHIGLERQGQRPSPQTILHVVRTKSAYLRQHDFDWAPRKRLARIIQTGEGELAHPQPGSRASHFDRRPCRPARFACLEPNAFANPGGLRCCVHLLSRRAPGKRHDRGITSMSVAASRHGRNPGRPQHRRCAIDENGRRCGHRPAAGAVVWRNLPVGGRRVLAPGRHYR